MSNAKLQESIDYLNNINLEEFLWSGRPIAEAMEEIDAIYDAGLYGTWTEDEFADYIRNTYGLKCYEKTILIIK